ncbi:hypothetical protein [Amycolatopsis plumensis]|uniref:hypothetical protein n=1 Tax=Amycolatopsis plumensis TaxID=236508 RepID=UPI0036060D9C
MKALTWRPCAPGPPRMPPAPSPLTAHSCWSCCPTSTNSAHDLRNIDEFIDRSELEEESYSATVWAWNNIVAEFREVPRLSGSDLEVIPAPLIERLDIAERRIAAARGLAQRAINRYNHQTMIKARTVIDLLDGTTTTEQLNA